MPVINATLSGESLEGIVRMQRTLAKAVAHRTRLRDGPVMVELCEQRGVSKSCAWRRDVRKARWLHEDRSRGLNQRGMGGHARAVHRRQGPRDR